MPKYYHSAITIASALLTASNAFTLPLSSPSATTIVTSSSSSTVTTSLEAVADAPASESQREEEGNTTGRRWFSWGRGGSIPVRPLPPQQEQRRKKAPKKGRPPHVHLVSTLGDYKTLVADETERIVVVRFYAEWCRACKAIGPSFYRLANNDAMTTARVKFVEVPLTKDNAFLHEGLGVPSLPFGHIYYPNVGLVEECKISKKHFRDFEARLTSYVRGECELSDDDDDEKKLGSSERSPHSTAARAPEEDRDDGNIIYVDTETSLSEELDFTSVQ